PVIDCGRGQRKHRIVEEYLATHTVVGPAVFLVLVARAPATVWEVRRGGERGVIVNVVKKSSYVNHYSFHIMDPVWGHVTIKMSGHPPFAAQVILNGHEYVARQAQTTGIAFSKEGNCFTAVADPQALAQVADTLSQDATVGRLSQVCDRWIYTACLCFGLDLDEQARSGFRYHYSVFQVEYSRNLLFRVGGQMDRVFNTVLDRTRARLAGRAHPTHHVRRQETSRHQRHPGPVPEAGSGDRDTSVGPDPVQSPLRTVDVEGLHQRRTRAALRGRRAQHQATRLRPDPGQVRHHRYPPGRHDRTVLHHAGLRRHRLHPRRHPRRAATAVAARRHPDWRCRPEQTPHPHRPRGGPRPVPTTGRVHRRRPHREGPHHDRAH